jgi:hypothetical protein
MQIARCAFLSAFATALAMASPCIPGTLADYEQLPTGPSGGCTVGPLDFHDFGFILDSSSGGAIPVAASAIMVTPSSGFDNFGLTYSSDGFSVTSGQFIQYVLSYTVDPPPPIIHGGSLSFDVDGPTFPGLDDITSVQCLDAAFNGAVCPTSTVTQSVFDNGLTSSFSSTVAFGPVSTLGNRTTITLDATSGGSANFASFTETVITPEPSFGVAVAAITLLLACKRLKGGPNRRR